MELSQRIEEILEEARRIGEDVSRGWDAAARFLGPYRREAASRDLEEVGNFSELLSIITLQMECLRRASDSQRGVDIGTWFHHVLHELPAVRKGAPSREVLREQLSRFFLEYARNLCVLGRYGEMRLAMRSSLDATRSLPLAIVALIHLYAPLEHVVDTIEGEPSTRWLAKRYAECLALLDFSGLSSTPFRATLDDYQAAFRDPSQRASLAKDVFSRNDTSELALSTLTRLYERHFLKKAQD